MSELTVYKAGNGSTPITVTDPLLIKLILAWDSLPDSVKDELTAYVKRLADSHKGE